MYEYVPRQEIIDVLRHVRDLLRKCEPVNDRERLAAERREIVAKYMISNLPRTGPHPTLSTIKELVDTFLLTIGAAHELFGYDLDAVRQCDLRWNSGRTHIVESYVFERDKLIDFPLELAPESTFYADALLSRLVRDWQSIVPARALNHPSSNGSGVFYVHVGTEDSRGSSLPPGSIALVEPIDVAEALRPNPRFIYLLQFGNGYRCCRCVVTRGRLQMLTSARTYMRAREFACPGEVRVAGRIRMFAHALPQQEYELHDKLRTSRHSAQLILPWEHRTRDHLLLTEYRRLPRTRQEEDAIRILLENLLHSPLTKRTERRYRHPGSSEPHVSTLIQLTLLHFARYSDALRAGVSAIDDRGHYSLGTMANARNIEGLSSRVDAFRPPWPEAVWDARKNEFVGRLPLLSFKFPKLNVREDAVVRLSRGCDLPGLEPAIAAGSWMLLKPLDHLPDTWRERGKSGWSRPLYVLRRGLHFRTGYLEQEGTDYALLSNTARVPSRERFGVNEVSSLHRVEGVAVPV